MCIFCERAQNQLAEGLTPAQKREVEQCERVQESRVPATILTGFLGAGKTTFLNFVLKSATHGKRIGIVQNEFGSVSIDDHLMPLERSETEVVVMPNGCLCCRVRDDLVEALHRLAERPECAPGDAGSASAPRLDGLMIECSGLSEVRPVAQTFFADPFVQASFRLDGVVCVCDASTFSAMERGEAVGGGEAGVRVAALLHEQLGLSDVCLLNKCDLVSSSQRDALSKRVREVNPAMRVVPCRNGKVNLGQVLRVNSFSLDTALGLDAHFLAAPTSGAWHSRGGDGTHGHGHASGHAHGDEEAAHAETSSGHAHDYFGSLGLEVDEEIDLEAFKVWLRGVVEKHGELLVRVKGVLRVPGQGRTIVQGVGGHIELGEEASTTGAQGPSRLVFIGRLDMVVSAELRSGFLSTASAARKPDAYPIPAASAM